MNVDLHTHTYPASDCSRISYRDYIAWCVDNAVEAVALTNHGDVSDNLRLGPALAAEGVLLIDGVEISTLFGDFVIFSPDLDYLETLRAVQDAPRAGSVPEDAAVVWVHPGAGGGRSGSAYYPGIEQHGRRRRRRRGGLQRLLARRPLRARSPSRSPPTWAWRAPAAATPTTPPTSWTCYTELPDPVASTADVVQALRSGRTVPVRRRAPAPRKRFGLF